MYSCDCKIVKLMQKETFASKYNLIYVQKNSAPTSQK